MYEYYKQSPVESVEYRCTL